MLQDITSPIVLQNTNGTTEKDIKTMKVLFVTNMYPVPDYIYFGIHVKEQIDALQKDMGVEADVFFINGREKKSNYFNSISQIKAKITNGNYDLIHVHYGISGLFLLFFTPPVPVVITLHSGELFQKKGFINHLMQKSLTLAVVKRVSKIVVLNDTMIEMLSDHKEKLIKLPCGTNLSLFNEKPTAKANNRLLIGFPGNKARPEKNFTLFSAIISQLSSQYQVDVVEFHNLTRDEVLENLRKIDLLLMTSTVEGSPQIIKEAMACNKAIVSTNVGDVEDLLQDVKNCYVINTFSPEAFIKPVSQILNEPEGNRRSNGREKLLSMGLGSQQVSERLYRLYQEVL